MSRDGLEPLGPEEGRQLYLEARKEELADWTLKSHRYRLKAFVTWCDEQEIENLNDLTGRDLYAYRVWRRAGNYHDDGEELETVTVKTQMTTVRSFIRFCGDVNAVPEDFYEKVPIPSVSGSDGVSDSTFDPDRVPEILDYLNRFYYAHRKHVTFLLLWHTGCRLGGARALDLGDCHLDGSNPAVEFVHRPPMSPLKNGEKGNRWNVVSRHVARVLEDYIDGRREKVTDDEGRAPLLTTKHGRISRTMLRNDMYGVTRPCWYGVPCPHGRDESECEATYFIHASKCPSSRSPHDIRKGRVTEYRREDVPRRVVSDRLNASEDVLDKHYDRRGARERAEQRRNHLRDI